MLTAKKNKSQLEKELSQGEEEEEDDVQEEGEEDSDKQVHSGDSEDDEEEPTAEDVGFLEEDDFVAQPPLPRKRASFLDLEATVAKKKKKKPYKSSAGVPVRAVRKNKPQPKPQPKKSRKPASNPPTLE